MEKCARFFAKTFRVNVSFTALVLLIALPGPVRAFNVFLDYTDFSTRMAELTVAAGVGAFSPTEEVTIRANIKSQLETAYANYSVSFSETSPGGTFETLKFGESAAPGSLGVADQIDFFNQTGTDIAKIFSANFDFIVESGDARATQITELSTALAGTAAHELGHNLGLRHYDAFGDPLIGDGITGGDPATGNVEDTHIMATGSTGLGETGRETERNFSELSNIMLEHSFGLGGAGIINAEGTNGNNLDGLLTSLPTLSAGFGATVMTGGLSGGNLFDDYTFTGKTGERLLTKVISSGGTGGALIPTSYDTFLELYDSSSTLLLSQDDIFYTTTSVNAGGSSRTLDSMILNYSLASDDTYTLRVSGFGGATGDYALIAAKDLAVIPEPSTLVLMLSLFGGMAYFRRSSRPEMA